MRDRLGNEVKPGDLLIWTQNGLIVEAIEAIDDDSPKLTLPGREQRGPGHGKIAFKVSLPVSRQGLTAGDEILLQEFLRVVNPKSQEILDRLGASRPGGGSKPS